jgi:hypothetical protein
MAVFSLSPSILPFVEAMPWTICALFQFPPRLSLRRRHTNPVTKERDASGPETDLLHSAQLTERTLHEETYIPETPHTGRNVLKFALSTLSSVSSNIPFGSVLSSVIDPLLNIINRIEVRVVTVIPTTRTYVDSSKRRSTHTASLNWLHESSFFRPSFRKWPRIGPNRVELLLKLSNGEQPISCNT